MNLLIKKLRLVSRSLAQAHTARQEAEQECKPSLSKSKAHPLNHSIILPWEGNCKEKNQEPAQEQDLQLW